MLQMLAATYHALLWALAQVNRKPARAALSEGERIIVPRFLMPMAALSRAPEQTLSGR